MDLQSIAIDRSATTLLKTLCSSRKMGIEPTPPTLTRLYSNH